MENARVIIIEDNTMLRQAMRGNLEACDHSVVGEARSVGGARAMIDKLPSDGVDVAVVDGNLSQYSEGGADGERVASYIHEKLLNVTVIGSSLDGEVRGADINIDKQDPWALTNAIDAL